MKDTLKLILLGILILLIINYGIKRIEAINNGRITQISESEMK